MEQAQQRKLQQARFEQELQKQQQARQQARLEEELLKQAQQQRQLLQRPQVAADPLEPWNPNLNPPPPKSPPVPLPGEPRA